MDTINNNFKWISDVVCPIWTLFCIIVTQIGPGFAITDKLTTPDNHYSFVKYVYYKQPGENSEPIIIILLCSDVQGFHSFS